MGADNLTTDEGGDKKPELKSEDGNNHQNNGRPRHNKQFARKEKFMGAHPSLQGYVFTACTTRASQALQFTKTDERIKALIGSEKDHHVLMSIEKGTQCLPPEPQPVYDADGTTIGEVQKLIYSKKIDKWVSLTYLIEKEMKQVYSFYYGQCDDDMKATLMEDPKFETINQEKDVLGLRKLLQNVNFAYTNKNEEPILAMWKAKSDFVKIRQGKGQSVSEYYERFKTLQEVTESLNIVVHDDLGFSEIIAREKGVDMNDLSDEQKEEFSLKAMAVGRDRMIAIHFLLGADQDIYGSLLSNLRRLYLMNNKNEYPKDLTSAYSLLKGWSADRSGKITRQQLGVAFNTNGNEEDDEGTLLNTNGGSGKPCKRCGRKGHPTDKCYAKTKEDGTVLHIEGTLSVEEMNEQVSGNVMFGSVGHDVFELMFLNHANSRSQTTSSKVPSSIPITWILLDSQSTIDVFSNADLLSNIHPINTTMHIKCNAGTKSTNLRGFLSGYGWVWFFPAGIANILSLSRVKEKFRVTYDSATDNAFLVHKEGRVLKFQEATRRLYFFDTATKDDESTMLVTTVDDNMSKFSSYDVSRARLARTIQIRIGRPSTQDFIRYVRDNLIPNCPITVQDIKTAEFIWGPDLGSLKGKTVRNKSPTVRVQTSSIPLGIMQKYRDVTLSIDVMKINGIPFFNTISRHIRFGSAGKLDNLKDSTIISHLRVIMGVYTVRGFRVTIILADNQFESMRGEIAALGAIINVVSRDEHVPEIERYNRTIKERVRAEYNVLPFTFIPPALLVELVYTQVFWRNMFALRGGISKTQSPAEIVVNRKLDFNSHCKVQFGEYVQTHEEHDNSMSARTVGAIATRPTGNTQGGYYFIRLDTGRRISRKDWTTLPMPQLVIDQVHRLARRAKSNKTLTFTNLRNEDLDELYADIPGIDDEPNTGPAGVVDDDDSTDDSNYYASLSDDSDEDGEEDDESEEGSDDDNSTSGSDEEENEIPGVDENNDHTDEIPGVDENNDHTEEIPGVDDHAEEIPGVEDNENPNEEHECSEYEEDNTEMMQDNNNDQNEEQERSYGDMTLRSQPRKEYDVFNNDVVLLQFDENGELDEQKLNLDDDDHIESQYMFLTETLGWKEGLQDEPCQQVEAAERRCNVTTLAAYLFLTDQMNWKKGLKIFHEKGEEAIMKELKQIHDVEGFVPKHWHELTKEERQAALKYLMYLKEKRDGRIKGRGCADGRPQRVYTHKNDSTSPTASLAGLIMTCVIDAFERRDVATVDIPGAFLQAKQPDDEIVHVVLDGRMAELLAKISPETYQKYVHHKRGQAYIYCQLTVALYGTLKAAMLFWRKLTKSLKKRGFIVNPYDWCVANMDIDGSQCTIVWHVDDLKISHKKPSVVDRIIESLKNEYGKIGTMTVRRGKVHDYLGMTLDFSKPGKFIVNMEEYIDEVLSHLTDIDVFQGEVSTPAAEHLFKTRHDADKLDEDTASMFHRVTAQLLWLKQRGRPDISTAVAFLCTRVRDPDTDDLKKLARVIKYIRRTKFLRLTMETSHLDQNHWFIDGAFAVHEDMRSHSGSFMTFGRGMMDGSSNKQKINTTSSTEAEVVAVHDNMPSILWVRYFLEEQGYKMKPSVIHQDNQSAMLLETNGRGSSSKRARHMNIRYFFVADVQARKQVIITYCPTDEMIGDFFTKPVTGAKFRRFRNIIMNCDTDEYGPVDIDELMAAHYKRVDGKFDVDTKRDVGNIQSVMRDDLEPTIDKTLAGSQECVGHKIKIVDNTNDIHNLRGDGPLTTRGDHDSHKINHSTMTKRTYAQVVAE